MHLQARRYCCCVPRQQGVVAGKASDCALYYCALACPILGGRFVPAQLPCRIHCHHSGVSWGLWIGATMANPHKRSLAS